MKKILIGLVALMMVSTLAMAGIQISWGTLYGVYSFDAPDTIGDTGYIGDVSGVVWQLIYAGADDTMGTLGIGDVGGVVTGDDVVWAQRSIPLGGGVAIEDGTEWSTYLGSDAGDLKYTDDTWTTAGFVYMRIYQADSLGNIVDGTWYYETSLEALVTTWAEGSTAQDFYLDTPMGGVKPDQQVIGAVPEPTTMALLGLGGLVMAIRRRRA